MRRIISLLAMLAILSGCVCCTETEPLTPPTVEEEPPAATKTRFTVTTWNVHHFFDTVCDSGSCGTSAYETQFTNAQYEAKLGKIASGIMNLDSDIVLLQEIEKEEGLKAIYDRFSPGIYTSYAFGEIGSTATVDVGMIVRGEITSVEKHRDKYWITLPDGTQKRIARELLQAEITLHSGIQVTAFVTHLVSKATDAIGDRRLEEAKLCHQIIADYIAENPNRLVIFGGDLNDYPDTPPLQAIEKDGLLIRSTLGMEPADFYTWRDSSAFDHIYYSAEFQNHMIDSRRVCDLNPYNGYSGSDHCALKATFEFE